MADAPEIKVKLTAEDTGVSAAIKELTGQLKTLKKSQDETAASGFSLAKAFQGIIAAAGAIEFGRIGKEAFDSAVNIGKMADKTGLTTQTLSVFHHVAEETSVATEAVDKALIKGARSITEFQQGSAKAAKGFQLLNITQKDFQGLKPDQALALVTERLGHMEKGFAKTTAAQLIFSKGGAEFIPVANAIAAEGFDKVTASVSKLGLLLDQETTDSFRAAKASLQELSDAGKGMATQFEAGMLPAISDVGDALLEALGDDGAGSSFKELGKTAGTAIKGIAFAILSVGTSVGVAAAEVEELFDFAFNHTKSAAKSAFAAIGGYIKGGVSGAAAAAATQIVTSTDPATKEFALRMKAIEDRAAEAQTKIYKSIFKTPEEEAKAAKDRADKLRPDKTTEAGNIADDSAAKAQLSILKQQLDQELSLYREFEKVRLATDQQDFEQGKISLKDYFSARRAEIVADHQKEIETLQSQKTIEKKEPARTEAEGIQKKAKIQAIDAKIAEAREAQILKLKTLETEEFTKTEDHQNKVLAFQKQVAILEGKQEESTRAEIAQEAEKLRRGQIASEQEIAHFSELKTAQVDFKDAETKLQQERQSFDIEKQRIEIEAKTHKISQLEAEQELNALIAARLPLLRADAQAELTAAHKTGNQDNVAAAQNAVAGVENVKVAAVSLGDTIRGSISQDFGNFFLSLGHNTASVANQFRSLASSVVQSLEQILVKLLLVKIFGGATGGGGGLLGGIFGIGKAEGGLITGPGGPKADAIPARLSAGEYVVKAESVSAFGVHNLEAINRGLKIPSFERLALPKFAEGGLVGNVGGGAGSSNINLGIGLDEGLILKHLSSKQAGNIILQHLSNNPKAASKALSRSQ
jgi:hypothetical protein